MTSSDNDNDPADRKAAHNCPICGKPCVVEYRPFCSKRCADVDLGRWLKGDYAIPVLPDDDEDGDVAIPLSPERPDNSGSGGPS